MVCTEEGEVRGFMPANSDLAGAALLDETQKGQAVDQLQRRKTELLMELQTMENTIRSGGGAGNSQFDASSGSSSGRASSSPPAAATSAALAAARAAAPSGCRRTARSSFTRCDRRQST